MAHIDIFNNDAFSEVSMTNAVEKSDYLPQRLGQMGIFMPVPIRTEKVSIEERSGSLSVIQTSERGAPLEQRQTEKRKIRDFRTVRIAKGDTVMASEIQNIRAFGSESELMQVMAEINRRISGPSGLLNDVELTLENMRLGAIQGKVLDADGSIIYDWFSEFDITQATEIDFDLDNATPVSGSIRKLCNKVIRQMKKASKGAWNPAIRVMALCGDNFWDDLTTHKEVRETYLNTQQASDLRNDLGMPFESFRYGGIQFENYQGTDDGTTVGIGTDKVKFFPSNAPGVFEVAQSPGESFEFVNTPGKSLYSMMVRDNDRNHWVKPEVYTYPLHVCKRPGMLQRGKRT